MIVRTMNKEKFNDEQVQVCCKLTTERPLLDSLKCSPFLFAFRKLVIKTDSTKKSEGSTLEFFFSAAGGFKIM